MDKDVGLMILFNEYYFLFIIFIKVKWNFYKQNLEWFDNFFKEFNVNGLEKNRRKNWII